MKHLTRRRHDEIESRLREIDFQFKYDASISFSHVCKHLYPSALVCDDNNNSTLAPPSEDQIKHFIDTTCQSDVDIEDVEKALSPGFSTASDSVRALGFGAGMGLPNIKKCADDFHIDSVMGRGTQVQVKIHLKSAAENNGTAK